MECPAIRFRLAALSCAVLAAGVAQAHPHMWIDARARVQFDAQGRIAALEQAWRFDEMFGAYTMQGLQKGKDGNLPPETLQGMARDWMQALGEPVSHYFTRVSVAGANQVFAAPRDATVRWNPADGRLTLSFTLPLVQPIAPGPSGVQVDIYDPTYFVAYAFHEPDAVTLWSAPDGCRQSYRPPRELDWATLQQLATIPADPEALPDALFAITKALTHRIEVTCS